MSSVTDNNPPKGVYLQTAYMKIWDDGELLCWNFNPGLHMDVAIARQCVADRIAYAKRKDRLCLVDMRGLRSTTSEARTYLAKEGSQYTIAGAFIIGSALTRALGNIFLAVNKPPVPTRLFTDFEEAKKWLLSLNSWPSV